MTKIIKVLGVVVFLFVATQTLSTTVRAAGPWDDVWIAIEEIRTQIVDLQNQITSIELLPGPQGEIGPTGPQGEAGQGMDEDMIYQRLSAPVQVLGLGNPGAQALVSCDDGNDVLLSGGFWTQHVDVQVLSTYSHRPTGEVPHRWQVFAIGNGAPGSFQAIADCLRVD